MSKPTYVVNFMGAPCSGKSTVAAQFFTWLKVNGYSAVFVPEEGMSFYHSRGERPGKLDEFYLFGKQTQEQKVHFGKVDWVVCEGPVAMTWFYVKLYEDDKMNDCFAEMWHTWDLKCSESNVVNFYIELETNWVYKQGGRYQTEEENKELKEKMKEHMNEIFHFAEVRTWDFTQFPNCDQVEKLAKEFVESILN